MLLMVNGCVATCVYMYIHLLQVVIVIWKKETPVPFVPQCHGNLHFSFIIRVFIAAFCFDFHF